MNGNIHNTGISIPVPLVEFVLLGPLDDRRQLQDSPILGDVWVEFGRKPTERLDLLIAPYRGEHAGSVATEIDEGLRSDIKYGSSSEEPPDDDPTKKKVPKGDPANIAFLQGLIVADLKFKEVMRVVAPKTKWWINRWKKADDAPPSEKIEDVQTGSESKSSAESVHEVMKYMSEDEMSKVLNKILKPAWDWHDPSMVFHEKRSDQQRLQEVPSFERFLALTALILWAGQPTTEKAPEGVDPILHILRTASKSVQTISGLMIDLAKEMLKDKARDALVWQVSRNRSAMPALSRSIPAVKADAATFLFKVNCSEIGWAVIDSGIDGNHPAFIGEDGKTRIKRSFDFKNFRKIVSLSNRTEKPRRTNLETIMMERKGIKYKWKDDDEADKALEILALDAQNRGPIHWELVEKFVEIEPTTKPPTNHGTHVAGIIGASKKAAQKAVEDAAALKVAEQAAAAKAAVEASAENTGVETASEKPADGTVEKDIEKAIEKVRSKINPDFADGMCPDISLYDFRVLGTDIKDTEFAIIAALQFIRYLNDRDNFLTIHGANLSLSIPHDVRNFACGRTPICEECERLVASGVVVVAAAGNHGYKSFETKEGSYDSYAAFSITDPGNADNILTVGATHRYWPHTYGVSFFSSRGPTGDGRLKPDLVAPGERIRAPLLNGDWGDLDGTSMAAPHVSGAAAMLMARYSELIGQPLRIKRLLCESATDLGRERSFQGHGMLDVLRAFQSI